jgi:hypothetical protein
MMEKMNDKIKLVDIYLKPDIKKYGVISFDKGPEIVTKGEEAALLALPKLQTLKFSDQPKKATQINPIDSLRIGNILLTRPLKNYTRAYVIGKVKIKQNTAVSFADFTDGINKMAATQNFGSIFYQLDKKEGVADLQFDLLENPTNTFVKFGLHYDGLFKSGILANYTKKKTVFKNDILSLDLILGDNFRYNLDYYIDNLEFNLAYGGSPVAGGAATFSDLSFTVTEPNGISLLDNLYRAVSDLYTQKNLVKPGTAPNYSAAMYVIAIRFYGYDIDGNLVQPIARQTGVTDNQAAVEKFIPFIISTIDFKVGSNLVQYQVKGTSPGTATGFSTNRGSIPQNFQFQGTTVKDILVGSAVQQTASEAAGDETRNGVAIATAPPSSGIPVLNEQGDVVKGIFKNPEDGTTYYA